MDSSGSELLVEAVGSENEGSELGTGGYSTKTTLTK